MRRPRQPWRCTETTTTDMADSSENLDLSKFTQSLRRLQEQHHNLLHGMDDYPSLVVEGIRESVIQRFEVCMDTCWKTLKRYLAEVLALNDVPNSPPGVFSICHRLTRVV